MRTSYSLIPSLGTHVFRHKLTKRWIKIDRTREQHQQDITGGTPWETVTLTSLGRPAYKIRFKKKLQTILKVRKFHEEIAVSSILPQKITKNLP